MKLNNKDVMHIVNPRCGRDNLELLVHVYTSYVIARHLHLKHILADVCFVIIISFRDN